jgi:hypothetical protein
MASEAGSSGERAARMGSLVGTETPIPWVSRSTREPVSSVRLVSGPSPSPERIVLAVLRIATATPFGEGPLSGGDLGTSISGIRSRADAGD